jgi:CheY-like chemotaxis protein
MFAGGPAEKTRMTMWAERHVEGRTGAGTVLVADDDGFSAEALADLLEDEGFSVVGVAVDGAHAVDAAIRLAPDLVLMDLRMPVMDGIEATRRITSRSPSPCVVMLSAYDELILRQEARRSGATDYLVKGCRPEALFETMRRAIAERNCARPEAESA